MDVCDMEMELYLCRFQVFLWAKGSYGGSTLRNGANSTSRVPVTVSEHDRCCQQPESGAGVSQSSDFAVTSNETGGG